MIIPLLKNISQRIKQHLSKWFPTYIKEVYFKELRDAIHRFPAPAYQFENEIIFIDQLIPQGAIIMDIGANRGDYVFAFELSGKASQIFALEPIPELNHQLKNLFRGIMVYSHAISDEEGERTFSIPYIRSRYFDTRGTLEHYTEAGQNRTRTIKVETITLDRFCNRFNIDKLDFIKIDVEGHEFSVLKGAQHVLSVLRPVLMVEIEQRHHPETSISEIVNWVEVHRYKAYYYDPRSRGFSLFASFNTQTDQVPEQLKNKELYINNFFFVPEEKVTGYLKLFTSICETK